MDCLCVVKEKNVKALGQKYIYAPKKTFPKVDLRVEASKRVAQFCLK
jgi:hypothetical protein